jgi:polar amino acid transport system substrate-binding protein
MKVKKFIVVAALCALAACLALAGCSSSSDSSSSSSSASSSSATTSTTSGGYTLIKDGTLTVATSPDFPPFENLENGEYVGMDMDIARAVADKMGLECEFTTIQFDGIIPAIVSGGQADVAISGITIEPEREEQVDFSDSYYTDDLSIVVMKDSELASSDITTALNDASMTIAVQSGTTGESYAKSDFSDAEVSAYGNANDTFAALQAGQVDAIITNKAVAEKMLSSYTDATVVKSIATGEEYGIAVSKDNPELTAAVNDALAELEADGTLDQIVTKWMS